MSSFSHSLPKTDLTTLCQACKLGKHTRLPFYKSNTIVSHPFEIVHSDIWTSPVISNSGLKYYLVFLDQYSHFLWVYPLHRKSDTFGKYLHFSNYVQTQFHSSIKSLQCDNGGEYGNRERPYGINRDKSAILMSPHISTKWSSRTHPTYHQQHDPHTLVSGICSTWVLGGSASYISSSSQHTPIGDNWQRHTGHSLVQNGAQL